MVIRKNYYQKLQGSVRKNSNVLLFISGESCSRCLTCVIHVHSVASCKVTMKLIAPDLSCLDRSNNEDMKEPIVGKN